MIVPRGASGRTCTHQLKSNLLIQESAAYHHGSIGRERGALLQKSSHRVVVALTSKVGYTEPIKVSSYCMIYPIHSKLHLYPAETSSLSTFDPVSESASLCACALVWRRLGLELQLARRLTRVLPDPRIIFGRCSGLPPVFQLPIEVH